MFPASPALAGGFSTTEPPGKPTLLFIWQEPSLDPLFLDAWLRGWSLAPQALVDSFGRREIDSTRELPQ